MHQVHFMSICIISLCIAMIKILAKNSVRGEIIYFCLYLGRFLSIVDSGPKEGQNIMVVGSRRGCSVHGGQETVRKEQERR